MLHKPFGDNLGHDLSRVVDSLTTAEAQRERQGVSEVFGVGGRELVGVGHIAGLQVVAALKAFPAMPRSCGMSVIQSAFEREGVVFIENSVKIR